MKRFCSLFLFCCISLSFVQAQLPQVLSFDKGWRFYAGDIPFPDLKGHGESYANAKAGKAWGAAAPEYNDRNWRMLDLPHDWAVENPYDSTQNTSQGYRKRGYGWYRKQFRLNTADRGKHLELQFEGIATYATIWVNGNLVQRSWCGYTSSYIDITSIANYGDEVNTVAVRVDANAMEGWWYEGAGIYRHTWLVKRNPVHINTDGVYAHPVKNDDHNWTIPVEVSVYNSARQRENITVESVLLNPAGKTVASGSAHISAGVLDDAKTGYLLKVTDPELWSLEQPVLYRVVTSVKQDGKLLDQVSTRCGFRTIRFDKDQGFFLNDKNIKLQGVCNHQDHAGVGVALPDAIWAFRLNKLKEMGVNAYRCSHNPPPVKLLELCDSLGILVMDENRNFNVTPEYINQLKWMVRRDRNHPSIILWSVFNEEPMQGTEQGAEMVRRMSAVVKSLDTTRPVTAAMNGGLFSEYNVSNVVDVVGFNYQAHSYDRFRKENPTKLLTSSEDISSFQIRGEYRTDKSKHIIDEYDDAGADWGSTQRAGWKAIHERRWLAGSFIWTGFDYRGEPTPFVWPTASSLFGILDLCGFPKFTFYIKQAQWRNDTDVLHIAPHWNWPADSIGKPIKVMVASNADSIALLLNGKKIGGQKADRYEMNTWYVPYAPGRLQAVGYKKGKIVSKSERETTGAPVSLQLEPYRNMLANDGLDAMPVTVKALDAKGREVPTANLMVNFSINDKARIIGLGNGNPNSHEPEKGNNRSLFNGLAQVIIQSTAGADGSITLTATANGLEPAQLTIPLKSVDPVAALEAAQLPTLLSDFRMSPVSQAKPDATVRLADNDMNSWQPVKPGALVDFRTGTYALFSTSFTVTHTRSGTKGRLKLSKVAGRAEVWLDDKLVYTKDQLKQQDIVIPFDSQNGVYRLVVLIEAEAGSKAGLGGAVSMLPGVE